MSEATELRAAEHSNHFTYTTSDDGVWIECSCGWRHCLGFQCSVQDAMSQFERHISSHPATTPTLDAREWMQRVWNAATAWAGHVTSKDGYSEEQIQAAIRERERLTAELLPHLTSGVQLGGASDE